MVEKVILILQTKSKTEKSSDEEDNQLLMCGRKGDAENFNEKKKEKISEEEEIGIRKCRRKSRIDKYNEEVRG